jgi:hypothetical protein
MSEVGFSEIGCPGNNVLVAENMKLPVPKASASLVEIWAVSL